ncbi:L-lactate MFS transporter [Pelagicoccus mobilis]|uniref:OFA family MFS transporter n=1 Tax=Pelagicoccus mobilis TaxID=415221 RepID=A0A934RVE3_9BACT|nr:OFA family MFS transporter [Pelagicoccus mobilis]MBK1877181.1 OFA family MFS transporter [Pelagicoccus mobilis]
MNPKSHEVNDVPIDASTAKRTAIRVLIAGLLSNFSVGILYTWSNLKDAIEYSLDPVTGERVYSAWDITQLNVPYSIGGMVFAIILMFAGALQDKIGPRKVMLAGIVMVGGGTILSGVVVHSPSLFNITFGVILGVGLGFVYACPRPAAMKWFHPSKKGMVNGLVVTGFGLGAMWLGPLEVLLLKNLGFSLEQTLWILGTMILMIGIPCALNVIDPPQGYKPPAPAVKEGQVVEEQSPSVSLATTAKTPQAWMLLTIYAFMCSAGAMVISNATDIMRIQTGGENGVYATAVAAILAFMVPLTSLSNASGRTAGGLVSDKIGRKGAYLFAHAIAGLNMLCFYFFFNSPSLVVVGIILACFTYGSTLSITPTITADYFGLKNYGANYGLIYYGWGFSLIIGPTISQVVKSKTGNYDYAYLIAFGLIVSSAVLVYFLKQPKFASEQIVDLEHAPNSGPSGVGVPVASQA